MPVLLGVTQLVLGRLTPSFKAGPATPALTGMWGRKGVDKGGHAQWQWQPGLTRNPGNFGMREGAKALGYICHKLFLDH